jgi:hypothetical protein
MTKHYAAALALGLMVACGGGGGGGNNNPPGPGPTPPASPATITIKADGTLEPKELSIQLGQQVRFVNNDSRAHEPQSNPHLVHTDCPALNRVGVLNAGQERTSDAFNAEKACGFHDHQNPDNPSLAGVIRVANAEGPGGPIYVKH